MPPSRKKASISGLPPPLSQKPHDQSKIVSARRRSAELPEVLADAARQDEFRPDGGSARSRIAPPWLGALMPLARPPKAASLDCCEPRATFHRRRASGPCWVARAVQERPMSARFSTFPPATCWQQSYMRCDLIVSGRKTVCQCCTTISAQARLANSMLPSAERYSPGAGPTSRRSRARPSSQ